MQTQVFATLLDSPQGSSEVEPDIAESAEYTAPTQYTVTLKPDLKFANGNDLTSSDVKFSFERQLAIADPSDRRTCSTTSTPSTPPTTSLSCSISSPRTT